MEMAGTMSVPRSMARMRTVDSGGGVPRVMKQMKGEISGFAQDTTRHQRYRRKRVGPREARGNKKRGGFRIRPHVDETRTAETKKNSLASREQYATTPTTSSDSSDDRTVNAHLHGCVKGGKRWGGSSSTVLRCRPKPHQNGTKQGTSQHTQNTSTTHARITAAL